MKDSETAGWILLVAIASLLAATGCRGESSSPDTSSTTDAADTAVDDVGEMDAGEEDDGEMVDGEMDDSGPEDTDGCSADASIVCCAGPPTFVTDPVCVDGEWSCPETSSGRAESPALCEGPDTTEGTDTGPTDTGGDTADGSSTDA